MKNKQHLDLLPEVYHLVAGKTFIVLLRAADKNENEKRHTGVVAEDFSGGVNFDGQHTAVNSGTLKTVPCIPLLQEFDFIAKFGE